MLKRIKALIELKETGIIDETEFEKRKRDILDEKSSWATIFPPDEKTTDKKDDTSLIIGFVIMTAFALIILFAILLNAAK